jgi:hypothetical protein
VSAPQPSALVVFESMFDNTATIAAAVARGLALGGMSVTTVPVSAAPDLDAVVADLLVVGAPTHAFSLSRARTRADAVDQGADPSRARVGIRDWLAAARHTHGQSGPARAAVFDTRVSKVRHLRAASPRARCTLERLGFKLADEPVGFLVEDVKGPLLTGETERATSWGEDIARACVARRTSAASSS